MEIISREGARARGLKHYFTGLPCKRGHIARRTVSSTLCAQCQMENLHKWRRDHPTAGLEWYQTNKSKVQAAHLRRKSVDPEKVREGARRNTARWRARAPEKSIKIAREWRSKNKDKVRENNRKRRLAREYKILNQLYHSRRRARKLGNGGSHTVADVKALEARQKGRCASCRVKFSKNYHVDHIIALARGGRNDRANLQLLCVSCNHKKHARDPIEFMREEFGLLL